MVRDFLEVFEQRLCVIDGRVSSESEITAGPKRQNSYILIT